jgi:RHS repeat-associated protein
LTVTLYANGEAVAVNRYSTYDFTGGTAYLGKDILGSVRGVSNERGRLEERYEYDAFGKPYKGDLTNGVGLGYTGKTYDTVTGMYNYGYRDYQPEVARFTTIDPIRDGANWFAYVNNDPVNYVDLWGLECPYASDKVKGLKTEPVPNEVPLSANAKQAAKDDGWKDITKDQKARDEAAADLKEKVLDANTKDYWAVGVSPILTEYSDTRPRTISEGALLNGGDGKPLPDITESGMYSGSQYSVYARDPESSKVVGPTVQYFDMDGNGRIDFVK